jgi:hypothetical protein
MPIAPGNSCKSWKGRTKSAAQFTDKGEIGSAGRGQIKLIKGVMLEISIDGNLLKREDILEKRF